MVAIGWLSYFLRRSHPEGGTGWVATPEGEDSPRPGIFQGVEITSRRKAATIAFSSVSSGHMLSLVCTGVLALNVGSAVLTGASTRAPAVSMQASVAIERDFVYTSRAELGFGKGTVNGVVVPTAGTELSPQALERKFIYGDSAVPQTGWQHKRAGLPQGGGFSKQEKERMAAAYPWP